VDSGKKTYPILCYGRMTGRIGSQMSTLLHHGLGLQESTISDSRDLAITLIGFVSIIDVQVQNRGESIYGPVISGFIRLKCCSLVPCDEDIIQKEWIWHYLDDKGKYLAHYLPPNCYYLSFYDSVKDHQSDRLIIRPSNGLIIQPTGRARGQFRRLGIYLPGEEGSVWLQQAREFVSSENLLLYEGLVMGEEEDLRYIISLI
jgi:hypothetical protein